jgi:predicted RNase H-like HicB family nuclease
MDRIVLTGIIYRDEDGIYVSHCNELDIDTCGDTFEDVQRTTKSMIRAYFAACKKLGTYDDVLTRLKNSAASRSTWIEGNWRAVPVDLANLQFTAEFNGLRA